MRFILSQILKMYIIYIMSTLRKYEENTKQSELYKEMYENQDLDFVLKMKQKYSKLDNVKITMNKALSLLDTFIDPSDPDVDEPNSVHAYQTAERIRRKYPEDKEYQIIGLIHDLGKVLFTFDEPDYVVVGDTFVVGAQLPSSMVYYEHTVSHPDRNNHPFGIYGEKCGLDKLNISFGHDEYLYQVLKQNMDKHFISKRYMEVIRYHSFYPWHDKGEYVYFMSEYDYEIMDLIREFNQFDLYSKEDTELEITEDIKNYYNELLNEYFRGELQW